MKPDAIIVGGGIQGATIALAMAERGLRPVIVERDALASGASGNSYGIVHGGLRYLQTLDVSRWRRSRAAQTWFLDEFPTYVKPLRCVMPLYQGRLRSTHLFQAGMTLQKWLASALDAHVPLPPPKLLTAAQVREEFEVPGQRLLGAACWYDAEVRDMPGLLRAMLKRGGIDENALYIPCEARELLEDDQGVTGLRIVLPGGEIEDLSCRIVINCTGAWLGRWQQRAECPSANTLAFNLILSGRFAGDTALAVSAIPGKGRSYFVRPHPEGIFAGTYYRPAPDLTEPAVTDQDVADFLSELDLALPNWNLKNATVKRVTAGLLPDKDSKGKKLSSADHILVHRPRGFYSVLGGKFTTAPLLSRDAIKAIWPGDTAEAIAATLAKNHA